MWKDFLSHLNLDDCRPSELKSDLNNIPRYRIFLGLFLRRSFPIESEMIYV